MYTDAGGKGSNIVIYYSLPNESLDMSLKILEGDAGIRNLLRDYKGCNAISIYIEEKSGPLLSVDEHGNILTVDESIPQLEYNTNGGGERGVDGGDEMCDEEGDEMGVEGGDADDEIGVDWGEYGDNVGVDWGDTEGDGEGLSSKQDTMQPTPHQPTTSSVCAQVIC
ncbi:hypothetical protein Salat_2660900 [Sesamum alatum]|uniref:Uncharacterized protein n=1 Tax=Sesamum alatum TaxID=300844 RepID=A0AAE2CB70_9LAMI|nr:hypothetical protein Salat_2660900 [Sesamum alatum]